MQPDNNNLPARLNMPPEQLTPALLNAFFSKEIAKKEYQDILKNLDKIVPTKDNLPEVDKIMKDVGKVIKQLQKFAKDVAAPYDKAHSNILGVMTDILSAILAKVNLINAEKEARNNELIAEIAKANAEKSRIENIKSSMTLFINNCTQFIATSTTDKQITAIQKRVGSEKSRETFYAEFLDEFKAKCAALDPLIKERKDYIKKMDELSAAALKAAEEKDPEAAADIKEQQEQLENDMEENILRLQEESFNQISNDTPIEIGEPVGEALKGRNYWRAEIVDPAKAYKKRPDLVIIQPNTKTIDEFLAQNREQWNKDGKKEVLIDGFRFFIKKIL